MFLGLRTLVAVAAVMIGCRSERPDRLAAAVKDGLARELGVVPSRVVCGPGRCDAEVGGLMLAVTVTGDRELSWEAEEVIATAPLVAHVAAHLDDLGIVARVDCGPALVRAVADARLTCSIEGGGQAWVRIAADGAVDVEVALTAAEVAERSGPSSEIDLERAS